MRLSECAAELILLLDWLVDAEILFALANTGALGVVVCEIAWTNHGERNLIMGKSWLVSRRRVRRPHLPLYVSKATFSVHRTTVILLTG